MNTTTKPAPCTYEEALRRVLAHAPQLGQERVALELALGRVLRGEVVADRDQPPFDRSAMDGFAVRSAEVKDGTHWPISGEIPAGAPPQRFQSTMAAGTVMAIATGAPLPVGADAVVPIEHTIVEAGRVTLRLPGASAVVAGQNVHRRQSDATRGQVVLARGTRLGPQQVGIAAAVGAVELEVAQVPRIVVLTTGDEVCPPATATDALEPQQIRNSNGPMLLALLSALGTPALYHEHVPDEPQRTLAAAREALAHAHLVITVGGVSVGQRDHLPWTWAKLGLEVLVHGVNIQPGKPVLVARDENKLVMGLPGNPVSVLATWHLFVWAALRRMLAGDGNSVGEVLGWPWRKVSLAEAVKGSSKRQVFRAARLTREGKAQIIAWHGSGDLVHTASAEGFVRLPMQDEPVPAGVELDYLPMVGGAGAA